VLKVDIEYGEWDFWEDLMRLPHTRIIQIEFHFNHFKQDQEVWRYRARLIGKAWAQAGFECMKGRVTEKAWYSEQLWVRNGS
jgi:hypothetical protein